MVEQDSVATREPCKVVDISKHFSDRKRAVAAKIIVAIPTLNEADHIEDTLLGLIECSPDMKNAKIVVADGMSTDGTQDIVRRVQQTYPNVQLIENPERLQSVGINKVVFEYAEPHHEVLVRVDAHSHYPPNYVMDVADRLIKKDCGSVTTVMDSVGNSCFQKATAWVMDTRIGSGGAGHRGGQKSGWVDHGHHAGFRLDVFRRAGGYDSSFIANEDAELDCRIARLGEKIWLAADIRLEYIVRPTLRRLGLQYWRYGRGRGQTIVKHQIRPRLRQVIPPAVVAINVLALVIPSLRLITALYLLAVAAMSARIVYERKSICGVWVAPSLLVMHHAWGAGFLYQLLRSLRFSFTQDRLRKKSFR